MKLFLLMATLATGAGAAESWQLVFEDDALGIAIDTGSFSREKQRVIFRERHVLKIPQTDPASLRRISELQYRKIADCSGRQVAVLSRAAFSENSALIRYEAVQASKARWSTPQSDQENRVFVRVCGPA